MKEVISVIRMNMINKTKRALAEAGIPSLTAKDVLGRGKGLIDFSVLSGEEKSYEEAVARLGQEQRLIPKRMLIMVLPDKLVHKAVDTIIAANKTGKAGDGKIFVLPAMEAWQVRTGNSGDEVLDET